MHPYLVLLPAGFTVPRRVATRAVRSYRTFSPLPARDPKIVRLGGSFSVALSVGSRRPGVTWRLALWSPDFPRPRQAETRLSGQLPKPLWPPQCWVHKREFRKDPETNHLYITKASTNPRSGCAKALGNRPTVSNPNLVHSATAPALLEATKLNCLAW